MIFAEKLILSDNEHGVKRLETLCQPVSKVFSRNYGLSLPESVHLSSSQYEPARLQAPLPR